MPHNNTYIELIEASDEQYKEARAEAIRWTEECPGAMYYSSDLGSAMGAITEYILFTKGLKVKRNNPK